MCSKFGFAQLLCGIFLYVHSFIYLGEYSGYESACGAVQGDTSHYWVMVHSWFELVTGSLVLIIFASHFAIKLTAILSYALCPLKYLSAQRYCTRNCRCCIGRLSLGIDQLGEMAAIGKDRSLRY